MYQFKWSYVHSCLVMRITNGPSQNYAYKLYKDCFTMKLQSDTQQRHIMNVQQFILLRGIKTWLVLIQNNSNWNKNILKRKKSIYVKWWLSKQSWEHGMKIYKKWVFDCHFLHQNKSHKTIFKSMITNISKKTIKHRAFVNNTRNRSTQ